MGKILRLRYKANRGYFSLMWTDYPTKGTGNDTRYEVAMKPVRLEVIAPTLQGVGFCAPCELVMAEAGMGQHPAERALAEYPQEWQDDYLRLADWVYDLADRYGNRLRIRVIDPQSPEGLFKSLRYRVRRYPAFVIEGKKKVIGWEREQLESALASVMATGGG